MTEAVAREFVVDAGHARVPATYWHSAATPPSAPAPLVLIGHGFTVSRRLPFPVTLVEDLVARGFTVAGIDAPGHGDRQPDGGADRAASDRAWRAHWREHGAVQIAREYGALLDALLRDGLTDDGSRVGYWGLSLATQYGVGVLAHEPRIHAAVLGLSALPDPGPRISRYSAGVRCPVFFILQRDDEVAAPARARALFDAIAAKEKVLRASAGAHTAVPRAVFEEGYAFLAARL
jgi:pimeloyl-ACP methyl ester carboxylesterase